MCVFISLDRVFYETLIEQRPDSEMAQEWCLTYGILEWGRAKKLYEAVCKRKGRPIVAYTAPKVKSESPTKKAAPKASAPVNKKRKVVDDDLVDTGAYVQPNLISSTRYNYT